MWLSVSVQKEGALLNSYNMQINMVQLKATYHQKKVVPNLSQESCWVSVNLILHQIISPSLSSSNFLQFSSWFCKTFPEPAELYLTWFCACCYLSQTSYWHWALYNGNESQRCLQHLKFHKAHKTEFFCQAFGWSSRHQVKWSLPLLPLLLVYYSYLSY